MAAEEKIKCNYVYVHPPSGDALITRMIRTGNVKGTQRDIELLKAKYENEF